MDWTLTGAVGGVAILAITVGYEFSVIARSNPVPAKEYKATPVLIPGRERPMLNADSDAPAIVYALQSDAPAAQANAPALAYAPAAQANAPRVSNTAGPQYSSRVEIPPPVGSRPKDHSPSVYSIAGYHEPKPPPTQPKPQISSDLWEVYTTSKASYFNLGGHLDKNGVVDSLASSYLRDALKKHKNYAKLPPQIQAYIEAPNVNLAKVAGYRALLGIDDKEMEEKQGVKFIRIATRSIEIASPGAADFDASAIDLSPLERMDFDLRRKMTLDLVP
jgi:hypothetical protein